MLNFFENFPELLFGHTFGKFAYSRGDDDHKVFPEIGLLFCMVEDYPSPEIPSARALINLSADDDSETVVPEFILKNF